MHSPSTSPRWSDSDYDTAARALKGSEHARWLEGLTTDDWLLDVARVALDSVAPQGFSEEDVERLREAVNLTIGWLESMLAPEVPYRALREDAARYADRLRGLSAVHEEEGEDE